MLGVVLEIVPEDLDAETGIEELLTHEFLHWILHPGLAGNAALAESLVERFASEWFPTQSTPSELRSLQWDWGRLWGSCGFRTDSFARYRSSASFETAYIVATRADLRQLPVAELWSLAAAALQSASMSHTTPSFLRVLQEARNIASAATIDAIVTSFAGRAMRTGLHGFILPTDAGRAHFVAFRISANDTFRVIVDPLQPTTWSDCEFQIEDATVTLNMEVRDGIREADVSVTIAGHAVIDAARIMDDLVRQKIWIPTGRACKLTGVFLGRRFELAGAGTA